MGATTKNYSGNRIRCLPRQRKGKGRHAILLLLLYIIDFYINWIFLFCNSAFEQGHLDTWRYKNALIILLYMWYPLPPGMLRFVRPVPGTRCADHHHGL